MVPGGWLDVATNMAGSLGPYLNTPTSTTFQGTLDGSGYLYGVQP